MQEHTLPVDSNPATANTDAILEATRALDVNTTLLMHAVRASMQQALRRHELLRLGFHLKLSRRSGTLDELQSSFLLQLRLCLLLSL